MNFQFTLSEKEVNTILAGLQELRFKDSAPVIDVLRAQIQANYDELKKSVEEEGKVEGDKING